MDRIFLIIISLLLLSASCDEIVLKKSVEVKSLNASLTFDETDEKINGTAKYIIENSQTTKLKEIYFFCNQNVFVTSIKYKNISMFYDSTFLYGYNIYRIKIPGLEPGKTEDVELAFSIVGPVEKNRFILKKDIVFLDPKEIWLPLPFLSSQKFNYTLRVKMPENYYLITGGKITYETISNEFRIQQFESETDEAIESGVLIITKQKRFNKNKIFLYTEKSENADELILMANNINNFLEKRLGFFEFSQLHLLDNLFQYNDMSISIEGETFANVILISNISLKNLSLEKLTNNPYNYIYEDSEALFYKILAHEIAHTHLFGRIRFEPDDYLILESMVDYLALISLREISYPCYATFLLQNRFEIQNLIKSPSKNEGVLSFLYKVNYLDAICSGNKNLYLELLKILDKKYRYTKISINEVIQTIKDIPFEINKNSLIEDLNIAAAEKIQDNKLYNSFINWEMKTITNKISKRKNKIEKFINVTIKDNYPFKLNAFLVLDYQNYSLTNRIIFNNSETNIMFKEKPVSIRLTSPFDMLEENLYDNYIFFENTIFKTIEESLNYYYSGQSTFIPKNIEFGKEEPKENNPKYERTLEKDRELSWELKGKIRFVIDVFKQNNDTIYIQAYKLVNNKFFSYVIIKGVIENNKTILTSIIDPVL
ncbi:MAG: hypothetical protein ACP5QT_00260 [Brevinematia bacterium]